MKTTQQNLYTPVYAPALFSNVLTLLIICAAAALNFYSDDLYYFSVREDGLLEWTTFWAFIAAAYLNLRLALADRHSPWAWQIPVLLSLFCFVVAMEEISWAQRILNYQPPEYFLAQNFQQELNLHNVVDKSYRKLALKVIILGFGVLLPLLNLVPTARKWLQKLSVPGPSLVLAPAFIATYILYEWYPWKHSGEWVELLLGLGFMFAALEHWLARGNSTPGWLRSLVQPTGWALLVICTSLLTTGLSQVQLTNYAIRVQHTDTELKLLARDFRARRNILSCGNHKRLYTYMEKYEYDWMIAGRFTKHLETTAPERGQYLLDPWNNPYWIRDVCAEDGADRIVFIYSFGPNRQRESTSEAVAGDDLAAYVFD